MNNYYLVWLFVLREFVIVMMCLIFSRFGWGLVIFSGMLFGSKKLC